MLPAGLDMRPLLNGTFGQPQFVYGVIACRIMVNVADQSGLLFLCVVFCVVFMVFFVVCTEIPLPIIFKSQAQFAFPINILLVALCYQKFRLSSACQFCSSDIYAAWLLFFAEYALYLSFAVAAVIFLFSNYC